MVNFETNATYTEYTHANIIKLRNIISLTGNIDLAIRAIGISFVTFKRWKNEKEGFKELIEEAKNNYIQYSPRSLQVEALKRFHQLLTQGEIRVCEKRKVQKDSSGNIIGEIVETTKEIKSPPKWVIERVLAKDIPIMDAINLLISEGIMPPEQSQIILDGMVEMQEALRKTWTEESNN